ncbi:unnamed protein product [Darwinula stevensoni]|uniref:Uncharacterized protein n=1 Tax=Darwinula stevensoni TaxID=69355 RepID=A0A7R9AG11_9CRUS|nr:unnamed protein product [Darwinula stevensoni]CAG0903521.1 unnamed protein product [Darwinula stevensoni]
MLWLMFLLGCGRAALVPKEDLPGENLRRILKEVIKGDLRDDCALYAAIPVEETWGFLGESLNSIYLWDPERNSSSVVARMVKNSMGQACVAFFISVNRSQLLDLNQDPGIQQDFFPSKRKKFLLIRDEFPEDIWHLPGLNRSNNVYAFQLWTQKLTLSTVCLYCRQGNTTHEKLKTWSLNRPLRRTQTLTLPKSFRGQFYGKHVLVPMRTLAPYGYLVVSPSGTKTYEGLDGQVLRALSRKFNFVSEFLLIESGVEAVLRALSRKFNFVSEFLLIESGVEAVRNDLVAARTADFVISGSTIGTSKDIVYSNPYWIERLKFITTKPMEGSPWKRVFKPFNVMTWLLLVLVLVLTMVIFGWLSTLPCQVFGTIRVDSWYAFQIMVLQSRNRNRQPDDFGLQIALGSLILFAYLIFACIYSQTLTSYMAVPGYDPPVDSMQDIEDREITCYGTLGIPIFDSLYDNNPKVKARLIYYSNDGRDPYWTLTPYRGMVKEPGKHCLATGRSVSSSTFNRYLMNAQGQIPFHVSAQNANMMLKVMILQRHCPYEDEFNDAILRLERAGLLRWWYDMELYLGFLSGLHDRRLGIKGPVDVPDTLNFDDIGRRVPRDHQSFTIQHLLGLFVILFVGYGLALLVFLGEIAWHRWASNRLGSQVKAV